MAEVEKDDLLGEISAAYDVLENGAQAPETTTKEAPTETADEKAERVRDEQGRFAKAEETKKDVSRETLTLKKSPEPSASPDPAQSASPPMAAVPETPAKAPDEFAKPPVEWKGAAKVDWNKLPSAVRAEIHQDYQNLAQSREALAPVEQAIAPYRDVLIRDAGSVESGVGQLMQFYKLFLENPVGLIQHIARTRGIDLGQPQGQPPAQGGTPQAPDINSVVAQAVQQAIAPIHQRFQQTETQQIEQTVAEFAADPRYPYFQDVKVHMGQLMQAGLARNMPEAYDKAVRLNDAIQAQIQASKAEEAKGTQAAEAERARKAAAASLRGSPLPNGHAGGGGAGSNASVLDDVRAAAAELSGS